MQVLSEQYLSYFIPASTKIKSFFCSFLDVGRACGFAAFSFIATIGLKDISYFAFCDRYL